jgi:hypothetical protein
VRFTIPYRQHRRASTATATTATTPTTSSGERSHAATGADAPKAGGASISPADLEQRREMAVKALQERAAAQPRVESSSPKGKAAAVETTPPDLRESEPTAQPAESRSGSTHAADEISATASPSVSPAAIDQAAAAADRPAEDLGAAARAEPKISFGRRRAAAEAASPTRAASAPEEPRARTAATSPADLSTSGPGHSAAPTVPEDRAVEVEVEIDDAPVHAPVSGTMITATHRTAGPPVLANPGVPALSGVQSAANAAMQGSDELLLEIAEAQSPDGRSLVVSEEVRSLLASAPGTLPAVAGQSSPAVAGRGSYTPSRRRMVQAPWVVRSGADGQPTTSETPAEAAPEQPGEPAAPGQRARLNERLAKRLGLTGSSQTGRDDTRPSGGSGAYMRSRRIGSR